MTEHHKTSGTNPARVANEAFRRLVEIVAQLRGPDGCPWDKQQTPKSMIPYLLEETYEVVEAIEESDPDGLRGELGDLFFLVLLQVQMAKESEKFQLPDVINEISDKLIRRHPHVFQRGDGKKEHSVDDILENWERIKMSEGRESRLDGVPKNMSGLLRAQRIQEKAAQVGFDWDELEPVVAKLHEEIDELLAAWQSENAERVEEELGDVLFSVVNVARFVKVDAESAMRRAVDKFNQRFRQVETIFREEKRDIEKASLAEMDAVWDRIKHAKKDA